MKAVMYPFRSDDAIMRLTKDFPELDWAVVASPEELAREIADAEILVTSNRVCTPAYGEALRKNARRLRWMFFRRPGSSAGLLWASRMACGSPIPPASRPPWCPSTR